MRKLLFLLAVGLIAAAVLFVPLPLVQLEPGGALSVPERIALDAAAAPDGTTVGDVNGDLLLTTVRLASPTALEAIDAWLDDREELVMRESVVPPDVEPEEYRRQQLLVFEESATVAAAVAERAAGLDVTISGDGALVAGILPDSPAHGELQTGDVITAVDGEAVDLAADVAVRVAEADAGDAVSLTLDRDGSETTVELVLEEINQLGDAGIGVALQTVGREIHLPVPVEINESRIGGPSAGLMLALTVYDQLTDDDITAGRVVAGTGTIDTSGRVGAIGGVEHKVRAAEQAGATVFLVPAGQRDLARSVAGDDLEVVGVESFDEAVDALRSA